MTVKELHDRLAEVMRSNLTAKTWIVRDWHSNREIEVVQIGIHKDVTLIPFFAEEKQK